MRKVLVSAVAAIAALIGLAGEVQAQFVPTSSRNLLVNGEALIANTGGVTLTGLNTTATYGADGFAVYANNAGASVVAGRSTANLPTGFQQAFSLNRTAANANLTQACFVQEIESSRTIAFAGQNMVLTAYLAGGATFSGASSNAQISVISGTGTDQGLAGRLAATWTGQTTVVSSQLVPITAAFGRVGVVFLAPATATELAVEFCWTPVGTAGATDTLFMTGAQLEVQTGACPAVPVGAGFAAQSAGAVSCATSYEHKSLDQEILLASRYFQQFNEANVVMYPCAVTGANVQTCYIPLPVTMRAAPTATITAGGLQMIIDGAAGAAVVTPTGGTGTTNLCNFNFANTTSAAVHATNLRGSLTTGIMACSARF